MLTAKNPLMFNVIAGNISIQNRHCDFGQLHAFEANLDLLQSTGCYNVLNIILN